jgi:Ca-activated chloride channel family protein
MIRGIGVLAILLMTAAAGRDAARQDPAAPGAVFSSRVDVVRVDVSVQRGNRAVAGLQAGDIEVFDSGVRQQVDLVQFEEAPLDVVLALDMSGSVQGDRLRQLRTAGMRLIGALRPGDAAALVRFTDRVTMPSGFTSDAAAVLADLVQPSAPGDTSLFDAAHAALLLAESSRGRPVVILFSDGADTASFLSEDLVLDTARRTSAVVYAVTSSGGSEAGFLESLAKLTGGRRLGATSPDRLSDTFASLLDEARARYLISYTPRDVPASGWHDLKVTVRDRRADVRARPGYLARP